MGYQHRIYTFPLLVVAVLAMLGAYAAKADESTAPRLRVCADPNNLPFSNQDGEGFENALAELIAGELGAAGVDYTWWPQRRGFVRNTLRAGQCDLIMGVPAGYELAQPTRPYYRSTYVFVYRKDAPYDIRDLDDPLLHKLRVGVHMVGDDYSNTPGAAALARRGIIDNLVGFSIYGDYSQPHPPSRLIEAVAAGDIDVAIAWGPLAGYFASRQDVALRLVPVSPQVDGGDLPFVFDIAMATRREDVRLRESIDRLITTRASQIHALLKDYGIPLVEEDGASAARQALAGRNQEKRQ